MRAAGAFDFIAKKSFSRLRGVAGHWLERLGGRHSFSRSKKSSTLIIKRRPRTHQPQQHKMPAAEAATACAETPQTVHKSSRQENEGHRNEVKENKNEVFGATRR